MLPLFVVMNASFLSPTCVKSFTNVTSCSQPLLGTALLHDLTGGPGLDDGTSTLSDHP